MKSQTAFLQTKILGAQALSLTPTEAEQVIEAGIEETQKLREQLYQKHVAPILEQNRLELEMAKATMSAEYEAQIKELAVQNWQYKTDLLKAQNIISTLTQFQ